MQQLITLLVVYSFLLNLSQIRGQINNNLEFKSSLVEEDAIGGFVAILDNLLNNLTRNISNSSNDYCISWVLPVGKFYSVYWLYFEIKPSYFVTEGYHELTIVLRPFGYCPYCCSIENPSNHIDLYFTNKQKGGAFTTLRTIKKRGLFKSAGLKKDLITIIYIHGFTETGKGFGGQRILEGENLIIKLI